MRVREMCGMCGMCVRVREMLYGRVCACVCASRALAWVSGLCGRLLMACAAVARGPARVHGVPLSYG